MNTHPLKPILASAIICLIILSCGDVPLFDWSADLSKGDVLVEVKNVNGNPIPDAFIAFEGSSGVTDSTGLLFIRDSRSPRDAYLTIDKPGYFQGSRRFMMSRDALNHVRVTLIERLLVQTINSTQASEVSVGDEVIIEFAPNSIGWPDGSSFQGEVNVYAHPISVKDPLMSDMMPGGLIGTDLSGERVALLSYGMFVLELTTINGESLQLLPGNPARMEMDVPSDLLSAAPSTMPMWSFDQDKGFWEEEVTAHLQGGKYVADLPHFSFWNCDYPGELVEWAAQFLFEAGPANGLQVSVRSLTNGTGGTDHTDENGLIEGIVPANEELILTVLSNCNDILLEKQIGPFSSNTTSGPYTLKEVLGQLVSFSGKGITCEGEPLRNGFAKIHVGQDHYYASLDDNGQFEGSILVCDNDNLVVQVFDPINLRRSFEKSWSPSSQLNLGTIEACQEITENILELNIPELNKTTRSIADAYLLVRGGSTLRSSEISTGYDYGNLSISFYNPVAGRTYSDSLLEHFILLPFEDATFYSQSVNLTITYLSQDYSSVTGTIKGTLIDTSGGYGTVPFTGSFKASN